MLPRRAPLPRHQGTKNSLTSSQDGYNLSYGASAKQTAPNPEKAGEVITKPTIFILGAGASCPYGYPSGDELRGQICLSFVSDSRNYLTKQSSRTWSIEPLVAQAQDFVDKFRRSSTKSIDLFLGRNPEFGEMGKRAIIFRILAAESKSRFREDMANRQQDWYSYLFGKLTDGLVKKDDYSHFSENNISFITFNYDRSLEHFLYESLANSFSGIGTPKIAEQLNRLRITHVFGQAAGIDVAEIVRNLRIIYEEPQNPELAEAHELINKAQRIFFLGFGYARENLEILNIPTVLRENQQIYGTALGCTTKEINDIKSYLSVSHDGKLLRHNVQIHDWDCLRLLREYL